MRAMLPWILSSYRSTPTTLGSQTETARLAAEQATMGLEARIESLELACAGLWQLLKFKMGCTDEELIAAVRDVDAKDGVIDGKIGTKQDEVCPKCGRKALTRRAKTCSWCGADLGRAPL